MKSPPKRPQLSERDFLGQVIDLARLCGWLVHHQRPARTAQGWRSAVQGHKGFPDLVLVRGPYVLFVELKTDSGKTTPEQEDWLARLKAAGAWACVWRPGDWQTIEWVLRR